MITFNSRVQQLKNESSIIQQDEHPDGLTECEHKYQVPFQVTDQRIYHLHENSIFFPVIAKGDRKFDCNRKSCPYCAWKLKKKYTGHYTKIYESSNQIRFLTLTLDPKRNPFPTLSREFLLYCWSKFRKRINRRLKESGQQKFKFTMVLETHKSGGYHAHLITDINLDYEIIYAEWLKSGGGNHMYIETEIDRQTIARTIGYMIKYMFKTYADSVGVRMIFNSQNISFWSQLMKTARLLKYAESKGLKTIKNLDGKVVLNNEHFYESDRVNLTHNYDTSLPLIQDSEFHHIEFKPSDRVETHKTIIYCDVETRLHKKCRYNLQTGLIKYDRPFIDKYHRALMNEHQRAISWRSEIRFKDNRTGLWYVHYAEKRPILGVWIEKDCFPACPLLVGVKRSKSIINKAYNRAS